MRKVLFGSLLLFGLTWGCGGGGSSSSATLSVSVSPTSATVAANATQQFTATVANDSSNKGVTWLLTQGGVSCTASCGTLSAASSASGSSITYTAPSTAPALATVTLTATSVADTSQSASATITVQGISVSISPASANVPVNGTQNFTATVTNDVGNKGVTWSLAQNGTACSPTCGTVSPTSTTSGTATTYTAPSSARTVTLTATSVAEPSQLAAATITVQAISVTPSSADVPVNGTQQFTATLASTLSNNGATWSLTQNGAACSPGCGTLSTTSTTSGSPITYTAPGRVPTLAAVTLTATSAADPSQSASATITVEGVSVSISPTFANVPVNGTQQFTATVANDVSNKGVAWSLTQNGAACSPTCGTISPASSASGSPITYTAPKSPMSVTLTAASATDPSQFVYATIVVQAIAVAVSPTSANVPAGLTAQFTATVTNDVSNNGVSWSLTQNGAACSPTCGTISPASTTSGASTTYAAPTSVPDPSTVTVTATSVTDSTKSASATVTVTPPISVSVSPTSATVVVGSTQSFTATVTNDPANLGVFWSLSQNGTSCSPSCGTVSLTTTASGFSTTYTAPTSVPGSGTVTLTATSGADVSKSASATITVSSSAALAKFSGDFAFLFNGYDSAGAVALAGRFTADGAGNLTNGLADVNRASGVTTSKLLTGTYTVGADGRGGFTLTSSPEGSPLGTFGFVMNAAGNAARFFESDTSGTRGSGIAEMQAPATFSGSGITGNYVFGVTGADPDGNRFALAGRFHADGAGRVSDGMFDSDDGGAVAARVPFTGTYTAASSTGRGTLTTVTAGGALHWAFYAVSPGEAFLVSTDSRLTVPLSSGKALAQSLGESGSFSASSLSGTCVLSFAGVSRGGTASRVGAGLATFNGAGRLDFSGDENDGGAVRSLSSAGAYTVAPSGRATLDLSGQGDLLVAYLASKNEAFLVGAGTGVLAGFLEPQTPGPFSSASLSGKYIFGTTAAPTSASAFAWGVMSGGGAGNLEGTADWMGTSESSLRGRTFSESYSVSSNGRAATGSGGIVLYLVSPSKAVLVDVEPGQTNGTISSIEK